MYNDFDFGYDFGYDYERCKRPFDDWLYHASTDVDCDFDRDVDCDVDRDADRDADAGAVDDPLRNLANRVNGHAY